MSTQATTNWKEFIKGARIALDNTQGELAVRLGVSKNTVNSWEKGKFTPPHYLKFALWYLNGKVIDMKSISTGKK